MPARPMTGNRKVGASRRVFRALQTTLDLMLKESAELMGLQTGSPCSYRIVKSRMADPDEAAPAKQCREWAVDALRATV